MRFILSIKMMWILLIFATVVYWQEFGWTVLAPICTGWSLGLVMSDKLR